MGNHFFFSWRYFFHAEDNACRGNTCFRILAAAHTTGGRAKNIVAENTRVVQRMLPLMAISIKSWPWDIEATCVSTKPSLSWSDLRIWRLVGSCHDILQSSKSSTSRIRNPWGDPARKKQHRSEVTVCLGFTADHYTKRCRYVEVLVVWEINNMFKVQVDLNPTMDHLDPGDLWDFLLIHWLPLRCFHCWARW